MPPALAALTDALLPGSHLALSLPAALATGCAVLLAGLIARELGCDYRAQVFTALAQATTLWTALAGHWLTPYSLEPAQWLLLVWLLVRWVRLRDDRLLLILWVGPIIAAAIASPTLVWQYANGWPQLQMAHVAAAGALGFQRRREAGRDRRRLAWAAVACSAALAIGVLVLSVSLTRSDVGEQIARHTADAYHALPVEQQSHTAIVGESYIIAAYVGGYSDRYRLPEAFSLSRSYGYLAPPSAELDAVLYIGRDPGPLRPYLDTSREVADVGDDMHAYVLTGQRQKWEFIWPRKRTLTVS